jgi:hypothetical protein
MHRAVICPLLAGGDDTARQVEHAPPGLGQMALLKPEVNDLRRPHRRIVHAAEERLQMRAPPALLRNCREEPGNLCRIGNGSRVNLLVDRRSVPPEAVEGVLREVTFLHRRVKHFIEGSPLAPRCLGRSGLSIQLAAQGVQRPSQHIGFREIADRQGIPLHPIQGPPPLLRRLLNPCILVERPRVQGAPQHPRLRVGCTRGHQGSRDGGQCISQGAASVPRRAVPSLIEVFVGEVVPRRPLLDSSQLRHRQTRVQVERLALTRRGHKLRSPALSERGRHKGF